MSKIVLSIKHDSAVWMALKDDRELKFFEHTWDGNTVKITDASILIECEIEISEDEQKNLMNCLIKNKENFIPHWSDLTPNTHRTVERIQKNVWEIACYVDQCLRKSSKGIRLTPLKIPVKNVSSSQAFPVMNWAFSEEEKSQAILLSEHFKAETKQQYENRIHIPFSVSFDQKTIYLRDEEIQEFFDNIDARAELPPFWNLYGIAWENFAKNKAYDSAILILSTSIETALKWCLQKHGDEISNYLIENMQSPSLDKLYDAVVKYTQYNLPEHFKGWLKQLMLARNFVAHKSRGAELDVLQIVRWFAMGEAILKAIISKENHPKVGYLVKPIGEKANYKFPQDSVGVILRQEKFQYEEDNKIHVIMDSGESYYFLETTFEILPTNMQKFRDIQ